MYFKTRYLICGHLETQILLCIKANTLPIVTLWNAYLNWHNLPGQRVSVITHRGIHVNQNNQASEETVEVAILVITGANSLRFI